MKVIFSDFDGTLTNNGKLGAIFFDILNLAKDKSSEFIIVSGRSISWGHFLLTHFDLNYCIMEGGGVILFKNKKGEICEETLIYNEDVEHLEKMTLKLLNEVPSVVLSADSFGRKTDRAIEFSQMKDSEIEKAKAFLKANNLNFSRSNVHINYWSGDISKFKGIKHLVNHYLPHIEMQETIFYGDAKNDESVFEKMQNTVGVSNIVKVLDELEHKPRIILEGKDNSGAFGVFHHLKEVFESSVDF
jgi:HAD superfamily hydrolase (TIGR01484 family)